jgi:hypothetical protein
MKMAKLTRYDLTHNKAKDKWELGNATQGVLKSFANKTKATSGGVLSKAIGADGGSVRIHKTDGKIQEERTYPRSADPKKSPG